MKKLILLTEIFLVPLFICAQPSFSVEPPEILPASPEPSAFLKASVSNVNLSTGAATVQLPLYTIKLGRFNFPLSLAYSTQGLKADEASSRVGLGWVLNATGMITRSVKGRPDELTTRLTAPADFSAETEAVFNYCNTASDADNPSWDSQADEFQFSVNGYSGKFVLDASYTPKLTATENLKIDMKLVRGVGIGITTITTPDGVRYTFGPAYEKTTTHNIRQFIDYRDRSITAFFLQRIDIPGGEYVSFEYIPIHIRVATGLVQSLQVPGLYQGVNTCDGCPNTQQYNSQVNRVEYDTWYLSNILTSQGQRITFTYEPRPDLSYDNRLKALNIDGVKGFQFDYYDVPGSAVMGGQTDVIGRFFLTRLKEISLNDAENEDTGLYYVFSYDRLTEVPLPILGAQDYLGYYKGGSGVVNGSLIPVAAIPGRPIDFSFRNPNPDKAAIGTLTSIQYPTGGKQEFLYEPNSFWVRTDRNTIGSVYLEGPGNRVYTYYSFSVPRTQGVKLRISAADAILNDGYSPASNMVTVIMRIYEGTKLITSRSAKAYEQDTSIIALFAGHSYRLELHTKYATERGYFNLEYDTSAVKLYDTTSVIVPGLRVKQIRNSDGITKLANSKYFNYASLAGREIRHITGSLVNFKSSSDIVIFCGPNMAYTTNCHMDIYSSSSTGAIYDFSGDRNVIYYKNVIESDDPSFANGGTEYLFFDAETGGNKMVLYGNDVENLPTGQYPTLNGKIQKTRVFDKDRQILREQEWRYETIINLANAVNSIYVRKRYPVNSATPLRMDAFDVIKITYGSYWIRLKTKIEKLIEKGIAQVLQTNYGYGSAINILPATLITTNSKAEEVKTENKYPTDFPADPACQKLAAKNIISDIVQQSLYRNNVLQQQKKTIYKDWFNDSQVLAPEIIQLKESPTANLHNEIVFTKYTKKAQLQEFSKEKDAPLVYIWDSVHSLPVCEVRGARYDQVAYAGFEDGAGFGNWQLNNGYIPAAPSLCFMGKKAFIGSLTKTLTTAGQYIVTLWTRKSASVNGIAGELIRTVHGWKLYQWLLVNPNSVTVTGDLIDELRLFPRNASVNSYTHAPYIGVTGINDPNNNLVYYEYDAHNRLLRIRDIDSNILKQYQYKYKDSVIRCNNKIPQWKATGPTRCFKNSNNNHTIEQREEQDMNNCSDSYLQYRWYSLGATANCPVVANCTGINKRVVNGICQTGIKVYTRSENHGSYWNCYYHYEFSDGYRSEDILEVNMVDCGAS